MEPCILNTEQVRAVSRSPVMTPAAPSVGDLLAGVLNELAASPLRPARDMSLAARLLATACIPPLPPAFFLPNRFSLTPPPAVSASASHPLTSFVLSFDFYPSKNFNKLQESGRSLPGRSWHSVSPISLVFLSLFSFCPGEMNIFQPPIPSFSSIQLPSVATKIFRMCPYLKSKAGSDFPGSTLFSLLPLAADLLP